MSSFECQDVKIIATLQEWNSEKIFLINIYQYYVKKKTSKFFQIYIETLEI